MKDLVYDLKQLCQRNRDGAYMTQADRERGLTLIGKQLLEMGYRLQSADGIRTKHVEALVKRWHAEGISAGTFKNRMSHLRWIAEKKNKQNVVARSNAVYGIPERKFATNIDKSWVLTTGDLAKITDEFITMSLRLQAAFGLRREESMKIQPAKADRGDRLVLTPSWAKGDRARTIPIRTAAQRDVLEAAKKLAATTPKRSLISHRAYKKQLQVDFTPAVWPNAPHAILTGKMVKRTKNPPPTM